MTNQLPRALLGDIALALSVGDLASAEALLGPDDDAGTSSAVLFYRALLAVRKGDPARGAGLSEVALRVLEARLPHEKLAIPRDEITLRGLPAPLTPVPPALESLSPGLMRLRTLRLLAAARLLSGEKEGARAVNGLLPAGARVGSERSDGAQ